MTIQEEYVAASVAICAAIQQDADCRKTNGSASDKALLSPTEFHDRCYRLAKFAVYQQQDAAKASAP